MKRAMLSTFAVGVALLMNSALLAAYESDTAHRQEMEYLKQEKSSSAATGSRRRSWGSGNYNAQYASPNAVGKKGAKLQKDFTTTPRSRKSGRRDIEDFQLSFPTSLGKRRPSFRRR